jgi:hypothetical protein
MILVDIANLSFQELKYLAKQEGVEDYDSLTKDDLLDELNDIFDIVDGTIQLNNRLKNTSSQRYVNSLSDCSTTKEVQDLPGVEALTQLYMETSIHFMLSDLSWGFAYWSISPLTKAKLLEEDESYLQNVFLRVTSTDNVTSKSTVHDIGVSKEDTSWNINLPDVGHSYQVALCVQNSKDMLIALAQSLAVTVPKPYWTMNTAELEDDSVLFNALFSSIVSRDGNYTDEVVIPELVKKLVAREGIK